MKRRARLRIVLGVLGAALAVTVAVACGSDDGTGPESCTGAACDGGSESSTTDAPGADTSVTDGGVGRDADADADSSIAVSCGDAGEPGTLDPTFGDGGLTVLAYPGSGGYSVALQPDGKILVGGYSASKLLLARLLPNGAPDTSFGTSGVVLIPFGDFGAVVQSLVVLADGRIVGAGSAHIPGRAAGDTADFGVYRWHSDGGIDSTFGDGGITATDLGATDHAYAVAVLSDGHLLVGGSTTGAKPKFVLVRYTAEGNLDTTFGTSGIVTTDLGGAGSGAQAMAVLPDGRILLAGLNVPSGAAVLAAARYQANGALDPTFADAGVLVTDQPTSARAVVVDPTGNATLAGHDPADFVLLQVAPNGSKTVTFGSSGLVTTDFGGSEDVSALVRQPDGRFVAAGTQVLAGDAHFNAVLARYLANGTIDTSFGNSGRTTSSFGPQYSTTTNGAVVSACGLIVVTVMGDLSAGDSVLGIMRYRL